MTVKQAWNKKIVQWVGIALSICALSGIAWSTILVPKVDKLIDIKIEMSVGKKVDCLINKVDAMDQKNSAYQSSNDVKMESILGKINLIEYRLDQRK